MKNLKTILTLLIFCSIFYSCDNSDENNEINNPENIETSIIGTWIYTESYSGGLNQTDLLNSCDLMDNIEFTENQFTETLHDQDGTECSEEIYVNPYTISDGLVSILEGNTVIDQFNIILNENTLTIEWEEIPGDSSTLINDVYTRI
jgi:hypothetical protein